MEVLEEAAVRWRARAEELQAIAAVCRAADSIDWRSNAAEAFRVRLAEAAARIERLASSALRVAAAFQSHGAAIDEFLGDIEAYADRAVEAMKDAGERAADAVGGPKGAAERAVSDALEKVTGGPQEAGEALRRGGESALEFLQRNPEILRAAGVAR